MAFKQFVLIITVSLWSLVALAGNAWEAKSIKNILVHDTGAEGFPGLVVVTMESEMPSAEKPSCVNAYTSEFSIDLSRPSAQAQYSLVLAAKMASKNIDVAVNDVCVLGRALARNIHLND